MKLFINEFVKDYKKKTTLLYLFFQFLAVGLLSYYLYRDKTVYANEVPDDFLLSSVEVTYDLIMGLSLVFTLIMFANNLTQEYSRGTAKFLYTRPRSRSSILTSKIFLAIFNYVLFTVVSVASALAISKYIFLKEKFNLNAILSLKTGEEKFNQTLMQYLFNITWIGAVILLFYISLVLIICIIFKTQILSILLATFMFFGSSILSLITTYLITKFEYLKYLFVNISQLADWYHTESSRQLVKDAYKLDLYQMLAMSAIYTILFLTISYIIHARRDITLD